MPAKISTSRYGYTATATSSLTGFPVANLNIVGAHPLTYSWRSNNQLTQQDLVLDMGVSKAVQGVALLHLNFTAVELSYSTNGSTYFSFAGSQFTVAREPFGVYYKLIVIQSVTARYLRVRIPTQTTVTGAGYFEVGMVWIAPLLASYPRGPRAGMQQTPKRPYLRAGNDVAPAGPWTSDETWDIAVEKSNTAMYSATANLGAETPVLLYLNGGNLSEVKIARLRDPVTFQRDNRTVATNFVWEELA